MEAGPSLASDRWIEVEGEPRYWEKRVHAGVGGGGGAQESGVLSKIGEFNARTVTL